MSKLEELTVEIMQVIHSHYDGEVEPTPEQYHEMIRALEINLEAIVATRDRLKVVDHGDHDPRIE